MEHAYSKGLVRTLGAIAFFATMPVYSPNIVPLFSSSLDNSLMGSFVNPLLIAAVVTSAAWALRSLVGARAPRLLEEHPLAIMATYALVTSAFYLMVLGFIPQSLPAASGIGVLAGVLFVPSAFAWGRALAPQSLKQALIAMSAICVSTALVNWFAAFLPAAPLAVLYVLLFVGCLVAYRLCAQGGYDERPPASCTRAASQHHAPAEADADSPRMILARFASVMLPALIGLSMFAFFMGVSRMSVSDTLSGEVAGNMIAGIVLVPLCLFAADLRHPLLSFFYQLLMPALATTLMTVLVVIGAPFSSESHVFIGMAIYAFFCMAAILAIALALAGAQAREFSHELIFSCVIFFFSASSAAGLAFGALNSFAQNDVEFMPTAVIALYCAYLIFHCLVSFWRKTSPQSEPSEASNAPADSHASSYEQRCERACSQYGLSPREREIFALLGRGHTASFIAKTLIISESTVYTHTRNIYQKAGIGSREELIALVSAEEPATYAPPADAAKR